MRKLVFLCAVLFLLGIALFSKPAAAIPICNCFICESNPSLSCSGPTGRCRDYITQYC
jgi:hypothetical protein